jgi:hypothetical protein
MAVTEVGEASKKLTSTPGTSVQTVKLDPAPTGAHDPLLAIATSAPEASRQDTRTSEMRYFFKMAPSENVPLSISEWGEAILTLINGRSIFPIFSRKFEIQ